MTRTLQSVLLITLFIFILETLVDLIGLRVVAVGGLAGLLTTQCERYR